jgi:hypothetical protein
MEGKSRKGRIEWGKKGSVSLFFTLPLSFHSYTFLIVKTIQDGTLKPLFTKNYAKSWIWVKKDFLPKGFEK